MYKMASCIKIDMVKTSSMRDRAQADLANLATKNMMKLIESLLKDLLKRDPEPADYAKLHISITDFKTGDRAVIFSGTVLGHIRSSINFDGEYYAENKITIRETFTPYDPRYTHY